MTAHYCCQHAGCRVVGISVTIHMSMHTNANALSRLSHDLHNRQRNSPAIMGPRNLKRWPRNTEKIIYDEFGNMYYLEWVRLRGVWIIVKIWITYKNPSHHNGSYWSICYYRVKRRESKKWVITSNDLAPLTLKVQSELHYRLRS